MVRSNSIFRTAEPTEPRLSLNLPCVIHLETGAIAATVYNISYSGLAVRLPAAQNDFNLATVRALEVPDIGEFALRSRWRKADQIGFAFASRRSARPILEAYFTQTGQYPD